MQRKTILFIPISYYLSDDAFIKIAQNMDYKSMYLDPQDPSYQSINVKHKEDFKEAFDDVIKLPKDLYSGQNFFLRFFALQIKKIQIIFTIWKLTPSAIVTTSDGIFATRVIGRFFPKTPFIILQTALITVHADKYKTIKRSWLLDVISHWFGDIFFPFLEPVRPFGLNHPSADILLWGDSSRQLLLPYVDHQTLHLVGNILFEESKNTALPKNKVLFLGPHTANDSEAIVFCEEIREIVSRFPEIKFRIRIHPIMRASLFYDFFRREKLVNLGFAPNSESLKESILDSTVVISPYSAATLDVIASARHVILYRKTIEQSLSHWFEGMSIPKALTTQGIVDILRKFQSQRFLEGEGSTHIPITQHWHSVGEVSRKSIITEIDQIIIKCANKAN